MGLLLSISEAARRVEILGKLGVGIVVVLPANVVAAASTSASANILATPLVILPDVLIPFVTGVGITITMLIVVGIAGACFRHSGMTRCGTPV